MAEDAENGGSEREHRAAYRETEVVQSDPQAPRQAQRIASVNEVRAVISPLTLFSSDDPSCVIENSWNVPGSSSSELLATDGDTTPTTALQDSLNAYLQCQERRRIRRIRWHDDDPHRVGDSPAQPVRMLFSTTSLEARRSERRRTGSFRRIRRERIRRVGEGRPEEPSAALARPLPELHELREQVLDQPAGVERLADTDRVRPCVGQELAVRGEPRCSALRQRPPAGFITAPMAGLSPSDRKSSGPYGMVSLNAISWSTR